MKKRFFVFVLGILTLFLLANGFADWSKGSPDLIINKVGQSELITGYINLSFENESGNNLIEVEVKDYGKNSKKILDLAKTNNWDCWLNGEKVECKIYYEILNSSNEFNGTEGINLVGFKAQGNEIEIQDLSFTIVGEGTGEVCGKIPFKIDLFDDGKIDYIYLVPSLSTLCLKRWPKDYKNIEETTAILTNQSYCETIELDKIAGKLELGALIKLVNTSYGVGEKKDIIFNLKLPDGNTKECEVMGTTSTDWSKVHCAVSGVFKPNTYEICVKSISQANEVYGIKKTNKLSLFIEPYAIQQLSATIKFNSSVYTEHTGRSLKTDLNNWIKGKNCSKECIIPVSINSSANFKLSGLWFKYKADGDGILVTSNTFFTLTRTYPLIDSKGFRKIQLEIFNLTAPSIYGTYELIVTYKGESFSEEFSVEPVPTIVLFPLEAIINEPAQFIVAARSPKGNEIVNYKVDWGDGTIDQNTNGRFIHAFAEAKNYTVKVEVTDSEGLVGVKFFTIQVGITQNALREMVEKYLNRLNQFEASIEPKFYKDWLREKLRLEAIKGNLQNVSNELGTTLNASKLIELKNKLNGIKSDIPLSFDDFTVFASFSYLVDWTKVNKELAESLAGTCEMETTNCKKAIGLWSFENINISISGKKQLIKFETSETILTELIIQIAASEPGYLIIGLDPSKVKALVGFEDLGTAVAFPFNSSLAIHLVYLGDLDPYELNLFAIPKSLSDLPLIEEVIQPTLFEKKGYAKLPLILLILILILTIAGIIFIWREHIAKYIKKQMEEMKTKKERKLFPNRADYYNLINFITNSFKSETKEDEIRKKLVQAGWKKEQIDYGIKEVKKLLKKK